jgi:hypothetical protein
MFKNQTILDLGRNSCRFLSEKLMIQLNQLSVDRRDRIDNLELFSEIEKTLSQLTLRLQL